MKKCLEYQIRVLEREEGQEEMLVNKLDNDDYLIMYCMKRNLAVVILCRNRDEST